VVTGAHLFPAHLDELDRWVRMALEAGAEGSPRCGIVFHAGRADRYYADDIEIPFRATPHFRRFACLPGADHFVVARPGMAPRLIRVAEGDFWQSSAVLLAPWLREAFQVEEVTSTGAAMAALGDCADLAFVGGDLETAEALGIPAEAVEPRALMDTLDWSRAYKTEYERACIRESQRLAGLGHAAVRRGMCEGLCEFDLHMAFLAATRQLDSELPYPSIVAWDACGAVLHYPDKRRDVPEPGRSLLVDSGVQHCGYASDITRTYARPGAGLHPVFVELLGGMEALQQRLVARVEPGLGFVPLHRHAEREIADLLSALDLLRVSADDARERGVIRAFFPHGLGHHLGLQVHDVAGQQIDRHGTLRAPPEDCPHLRSTRDLDAGQVVTIEPGIYFIPKLLDELRAGASRDAVDWGLVDALLPCGGIRIEDDVLVTADGCENLTRPFVPGHLDDPVPA